jgi:hypothetical protein
MLTATPHEAAWDHDRRRPAAHDSTSKTRDMVTRLIRALAALAGAVLFSQFPAFYDQYVQRLGGRLDQARLEIARIETAARLEHLTIDQYIAVFETNAASPVRRQGRIMRDQYADLQRLETAFAALDHAPTAVRPVRFARHVETDLARAAFGNFQPALPLGPEGLTYALVGLIGGLLAARGGGRALGALIRPRRSA